MGPDGVLSGIAERFGSAVSDSIGIDVERGAAEAPGPAAPRPREDDR